MLIWWTSARESLYCIYSSSKDRLRKFYVKYKNKTLDSKIVTFVVCSCYKLFFPLFVSHQERMDQSLMQRHQAVRPVERAGPTRHALTQLWRCWVVCSWCCVSPPPGLAPLRWSSWHSSRSLVLSSSPGSAATGISSSSPSTTRDMWSPQERNRLPSRNSGTLPT